MKIDKEIYKGWGLIIRTFFKSHLQHEIHDFFEKILEYVVFVQAKTVSTNLKPKTHWLR